LPDPIAFSNPLGDFGFETLVQDSQRLLFADALGRLDATDQDPAYAVRSGFLRDRAVADRKARIFDRRALAAEGPGMILGKKRFPLAAQDGFVQASEFGVDLPPDLAQCTAQRLGMLVAQNGSIGIVVNKDQFGPPSDRHRKPRGEDHCQA
jgi:hypothetical protein